MARSLCALQSFDVNLERISASNSSTTSNNSPTQPKLMIITSKVCSKDCFFQHSWNNVRVLVRRRGNEALLSGQISARRSLCQRYLSGPSHRSPLVCPPASEIRLPIPRQIRSSTSGLSNLGIWLVSTKLLRDNPPNDSSVCRIPAVVLSLDILSLRSRLTYSLSRPIPKGASRYALV